MGLVDWGFWGFIIAPLVKAFLTLIAIILGIFAMTKVPKTVIAISLTLIVLIIIIAGIWVIL